ncbi:unknown [Clostridium sp. CAG:306]|nr:unknown [Clostridium sp. CAG:306]
MNLVLAEEIGLKNVQTQKVEYTPKIQKETKELTIDEDTALKGIVNLQQKKDLEDIDMLWKATVENNNIIKFAMKKLSVPPNQQRYHSSILAKSVSALVNGASFIPAMFGADYMIQSASYATGRLANNYLAKANNPKEIPLTDTELIELAGMIESLQDQIINSYYNYKMSLNQIKDTRQRLVLYNKNYSQALKSDNQMEIVVSGAMYDDLLFEEFEQMRQARKYQMDLERLAGKKTVQSLNLYQYAFKNELFSQKLLNSKQPKPSDKQQEVKNETK